MPSTTQFSLLFAAIGVVSIVEFFYWGARGQIDLTGLILIGWATLPSFALAALALIFQHKTVPSFVICIGGAIPTPLVFGWYLDTLSCSDAQRISAFRLIPLYQLFFVGLLLVIALIARVIGRISRTQLGQQVGCPDGNRDQDVQSNNR